MKDRIELAGTSEPQTVLVTGGAGFIGSALTRRLLDAGRRVVVYDIASSDRNGRLVVRASDSIRHVVGDILDRDLLLSVLRDECVDMIFHLAARVGVRHGDDEAEEYRRVNVDGTASVLQAAVAHRSTPVFFASSSSVYGESTGLPMSEDDRVDPKSHYGQTKWEGERLCRTAREEQGLDVRIGRYFTVYGPNGRGDMAIPRLFEAARTGTSFTLSGDGAARRDWTFIDDTIDGTLRLMGGGHSIHLMNIATGRSTSLRRVIELIEGMTGARIPLSPSPRHRSDLAETVAELSRAASIGVHPRYTIESGLRRCLDYPHLPTPGEPIARSLTQQDH